MLGRITAPTPEPLKLIEYKEKLVDISAKKIKKSKTTQPNGTIIEQTEIEDLSQKSQEKSLSEVIMQKKHIVSYSFGIDKDLKQIHRLEYQKLYNLPLINEVYFGGYGSIKENKPNEIGLSVSKLF